MIGEELEGGKGLEDSELSRQLKTVATSILGGAGTALGQAFLLDKLGYGASLNNIGEDQFPGTNPWERLGAGGSDTGGAAAGQASKAAQGFSTLLETIIQARAATLNPDLTSDEQNARWNNMLGRGASSYGLSEMALQAKNSLAAQAGINDAQAAVAYQTLTQMSQMLPEQLEQMDLENQKLGSEIDILIEQGEIEKARAALADLLATKEAFGPLIGPLINSVRTLTDEEIDEALLALASLTAGGIAMRGGYALLKYLKNFKAQKNRDKFAKKVHKDKMKAQQSKGFERTTEIKGKADDRFEHTTQHNF